MDSGIYASAALAPVPALSLLANAPVTLGFEAVRGIPLAERVSRHKDRLADPTRIPSSSGYCAVSMALLIVRKTLRNFGHADTRQTCPHRKQSKQRIPTE